MKIIHNRAILFVASFCLFSCAVPPLATPSGRPEVQVGFPVSRPRDVAIDAFTAEGFVLTNESLHSLEFQKDLPPAQSVIMLAGVGNSYHSQPKAVIRLTFTSVGNKIRIIGQVHAATQGPFGQIKTVDMTSGNSARQLQSTLEAVKHRLSQR